MLKPTSHFDEPPVEGVAMGTYATPDGYLSHLPANEQRVLLVHFAYLLASMLNTVTRPLFQKHSHHTLCLPQHDNLASLENQRSTLTPR